MILSLQGCMAVGKTTAVRYLQEHAPDIHISYEDNSDVIAEIKQRNLDSPANKNQAGKLKIFLCKISAAKLRLKK